jgi:prolipoprotein diacylglyceryltransferase
MNFNSGDIIIFRKKNYKSLFTAFKTLNLDNDIAIVIDDNNIIQINNYQLHITTINSISNYEYYHYNCNCNFNLNQDFNLYKNTIDFIKKNYPSSNFNKINDLREMNYLTLKNTNNVLKPGLFELKENQLNPYALSYLIAPIFEYFVLRKLVKINNFNFLFSLILIFSIVSARIMSKLHGNSNGMRFVGSFFGLTLLVLLLEKIYKYPSLKIFDSIILVIGFRIFLTRFVSWFINDINAEIDPDTGIPYDTVLYEAIFEGLVPMILCWILRNKLKDGQIMLVWVFTYAFFRIIIENFKNSYLNSNYVLTQGQIDVIPVIFISLWLYFTRRYKKQSYMGYTIISLLYLDLCLRAKNIKEKTYNIFNFDLIIKKTKNNGFINNYFNELNKQQKLLINIVALGIQSYFVQDMEKRLLLILISSLNIGERYLDSYVTDYATIKFNKLGTLNLNISDILINIYSFI